MEEGLMLVAESKATHQVLTGRDDEGWEYPDDYHGMFGRSLLMETLLKGPSTTMPDRLLRMRDLFDGEWIRCGIGVAGSASGQVVVALILCREPWEPAVEEARAANRSLLQRLVNL